jgi:hypothetical protein
MARGDEGKLNGANGTLGGFRRFDVDGGAA